MSETLSDAPVADKPAPVIDQPVSVADKPVSAEQPAAPSDTTPDTAEAVRSLEDLAGALGDGALDMPSDAPVYEPRIDELGRSYATGKRKDAVARVWVKPGSGKITIRSAVKRQDKTLEEYFGRPVLQLKVRQPLQLTDRETQFDVFATVSGGGLSGQAGALRHGVSLAISRYEPGLRAALKKAGFITRDSRVVERKKYGRAKARRSFQFSKR